MSVAIIDYGSGNLRSAAKAFERAIADAGRGGKVAVTSRPEDVKRAERIVLPGVGAFADCRRGLDALPGMVETLTEEVIGKGKPFLGICVGMQLMADVGLEHTTTKGLGWIKGEVAALEPADRSLKIPHMGWNDLQFEGVRHPVFAGVPEGAHVYFVHSYGFRAADPSTVAARVDYGGPQTAAVARDNLVGTQFHPEKSQAVGLRLIANFLEWRP
ncbi:MAG: imidazole glycerol phosphate synthase subunit HisH [Rhodospirillales bacterium]|nr:imidazole glycerol phosphate synthase subunit HisH [Rhodospirillales bacterium]